MRLDMGQIEVVDDEIARILRTMTGAQRLRIANDMFVSVRKAIATMLRSEHPDWDETAIMKETARRLSHGAI